MAKHEISHDCLNALLEDVKKRQAELLWNILEEEQGGIGGLLGQVVGQNGIYDVESVYLDKGCRYVEPHDREEDAIACHLDYPSFEVDVNYLDLSIDERQQILELVIKEIQKLQN